jgi:preprotein translocase subunit SecD
MTNHNWKVFVLVVLLTVGAIVVDMPATINWRQWTFTRPQIPGRDLEIKEGLDLAGGTRLTLQADMTNIPLAERNNALASLKSIVERRVNMFGVSEPLIQTAKTNNDYRLIVELAGVTDAQQALDLIGKTAELTFRETAASESADIATAAAQMFGPYQILTNLSGRDLQKATPAFDQRTSEPIIQLTFTSDGAKKFAEITKRNLNKQVAIFLDNQVVMAPTVQTVIADGQAIISGKFTAAQTKELSIQLNAGALPAPVKVLSQKTIPPNLGQDSINKSLLAGAVGLGIVALFMITNYGKLGLFADLALIIYSLLVLAIFKLVPVTLTLAGIAGFILSIGMAVDANILVFERMREEIRWGRNKLAAMELGFVRAFPSIRDSNFSSLITCAILFWFGTGPIKGFAVTLAIGILVSLFTAIVVTRTLLRLAAKYV